MSEKIDQILKKTVKNTSKANSLNSSNIDSINVETAPQSKKGLLGDPDCPHCGGLGYLRADVPVDHPEFGKVTVCTCRQTQVSDQVRSRLFALSNLDKLQNLTFETFDSRGRIGIGPFQANSIEQAYNESQRFTASLQGWLLLQGGYGCGKTHLAAAIANYIVNLGIPALFITVPDLLDMLRYAYNDPNATFEARFEEIRAAPLLILDDFGTQNATSWAQEKLFQILNYRHINRLPLVITTNLSLEVVEGRIKSRLQDPELVSRVRIQAPDYRRPVDDTGHHELSSLQHLGKLTFGTLDLRKSQNIPVDELKSLEKAFHAAQQYAQTPEGWLVFIGAFDTGKTHLAAAIANYRAGLGFPPLFIMVPDLLDHLRATFAPDSKTRFDRLFHEVRTTPLLILDDLGTQSMTPWVREKLYQLFNFRFFAELPTVITMVDSIEELNRAEPRLASRMLDTRLCTIYAITVPPYRGGMSQDETGSKRRSRR